MSVIILRKFDPSLQPDRYEFDPPVYLSKWTDGQSLCDLISSLVRQSYRPFFGLEVRGELTPEEEGALTAHSFEKLTTSPLGLRFMYPYAASFEMINADTFRAKGKRKRTNE